MPLPPTTLQIHSDFLTSLLLCGKLLAMGPHMARVVILVTFVTLLVFGSAEATGYRRILQSNDTAPASSSGSACSVNTCDFYFQGYQNSVPIFQYVINPFLRLTSSLQYHKSETVSHFFEIESPRGRLKPDNLI